MRHSNIAHAPSSAPYTPPTISAPAALPRLLLRFLLVCALVTLAGFAYSEVCRAMGLGLPYSFPYYFIPGDMFSDVRAFWYKFQAFGQESFFTPANGYFMYPVPLLYVFVGIFKSGHAFALFLTLLCTLTGLAVFAFAKTMRSAGLAGKALVFFIVTTVMLSYPLAFLYLRLNIEILIFAFTTLGVFCWWRESTYWAAFWFGLAGACKIYPLIFLGLLFAQKRYREVGWGVVVAAGITLSTLWLLGPTIKQAYLWDAFQIGLFQKRFAGQVAHVGYDHSFFALVKVATLPWRPDLTQWVAIYTRIAAVLALLFYFTLVIRLPRFNQLLVLSILSITLPPVSYDYTLLALYPSFVLLCCFIVQAACERKPLTANVWPHLLLFTVIFTPLSFVIVGGSPYGAQLRCIAMIGLLWLAVRHPLLEPVKHTSTIQKMAISTGE